MKTHDGLPLVKIMMLLSSMAPLFVLVGVRGLDQVIEDEYLWLGVGVLVIFPYIILRLRVSRARKSNDTYVIDVSDSRNNKEYLFTYLFTVLLPLYSVAVSNYREFYALVLAIGFVIFVLWNMNLHFINLLFAFQGYRVYTIESFHSSILLSKRHKIPSNLKELKVYRLSNSVFTIIDGDQIICRIPIDDSVRESLVQMHNTFYETFLGIENEPILFEPSEKYAATEKLRISIADSKFNTMKIG